MKIRFCYTCCHYEKHKNPYMQEAKVGFCTHYQRDRYTGDWCNNHARFIPKLDSELHIPKQIPIRYIIAFILIMGVAGAVGFEILMEMIHGKV